MLEEAGAVALHPRLWRWTAYHPEWKDDVGCLAYTDGADLVLIDPMGPDDPAAARRFWRALDDGVARHRTPVHVVITVHWHERHAPAVVDRYGGSLWAAAGSVSRISCPVDHAVVGGERLPAGIEAIATARADEVALWLPAAGAIVAGDVLLGGKRKPLRVCPQSWLPRGVARADLVSSLRPLLELPAELVVPAHGAPILSDAREILAAALS